MDTLQRVLLPLTKLAFLVHPGVGLPGILSTPPPEEPSATYIRVGALMEPVEELILVTKIINVAIETLEDIPSASCTCPHLTISDDQHLSLHPYRPLSNFSVTPELLSEDFLTAVIDIAQNQWGLTPIYSKRDIALYYPLLTFTYIEPGGQVHVPFRDPDTYILYNIFPFPSLLHNTSYILNLPSSTPLVSLNSSRMAFPDISALSSCTHFTYHTRICPACHFAFCSWVSQPCMFNVIQNGPVAELCPLTEVSSQEYFSQYISP